MDNAEALVAIYHPYAAKPETIIPGEVQDFIRDRMEKAARDAGVGPRKWPDSGNLVASNNARRTIDHARVIELRKQGMTVRQIADTMKIRYGAARHILLSNGILGVEYPIPAPEVINGVRAMAKEGATQQAAMERYGLGGKVVRSIFRNEGIEE